MSAGRLSSIFDSRLVALLALGLTGAAFSAGCAIENALVDGSCADGYQLCGSACVDVQTEVGNCGTCGNVCLGQQICIAGSCGFPGAAPPGSDSGASSGSGNDGAAVGSTPGEAGPGVDGGAPSQDAGGTDDDSGRSHRDGGGTKDDGSANDDGGSASDGGGANGEGGANGDGGGANGDGGGANGEGGANGDGGSQGNDGASASDDGGPASSSDDAASGGNDASSASDATMSSDAGNPSMDDAGTLGADASTAAPPDASAGGDASVVMCVEPLVRCEGVCTDLQSDAFNCGVCGHFCPTYICQSGACVGSLPGQFVLIGHDYASSIPVATPQARLLVNTIFGSGSPTVRVLAYEQYAAQSAVASVTAILNGYASATHRQIAITFTNDPADVPSRLDTTNFDALLVLDEPAAPAGVLGPIGAGWASVVQAYATAGGTVVVLDGATAPEMPALVTNAGMFTLNSQTALASTTQVVNLAPGDSVGSGVESPYLPTAHSAYFGLTINAPQITSVVFDQTDGAPVVVQRVVQ